MALSLASDEDSKRNVDFLLIENASGIQSLDTLPNRMLSNLFV